MRTLLVGALCIAAFTLPDSRAGSGITITGRVTSDNGAPVGHANIVVARHNAGTQADAAGRYRLRVPGARAGDTLEVMARFIGFTASTRTVQPAADTITVDFVLQTAPFSLGETVVSGVGERSESTRLTFSIGKAAADASSYRGAAPPHPSTDPDPLRRIRRNAEPGNTEQYDRIAENPFLAARGNPLSTFSIDVDRASYSNVRRFISQGQLPPADAVRIEELLNYFTYALPEPDGEHPFSVTTELSRAPWNPEHRLLRIGLQSKRIETAELPPSNLVFLIDVSGSMMPPNRLPLVKQSFRLLVNELRPQDRVAIVVYAGAAGVVLPSTPGTQKDRILDAILALEAGGSTAGGAGIRLAYDIAKQNHIPGGNNRVILATDGDFNVGVSSNGELVQMIEERRKQGTFLTVLGYGMGNYKDSRLEQLSNHGNGNFAYIDDLMEAKKVLVSEFGGTLFTVAKDVKLQLEFNPARVAAYRLIGYENRLLRSEDFEDDAKDAGEMGAGHSVTALYEIIPVSARTTTQVRDTPELRYQQPASDARTTGIDELLLVRIRYKDPDGEQSRLLEQVVLDRTTLPSADFRFAAAVSAYGMLLRDSEHRGSATFEDVLGLAREGTGPDREGYRAEFIRMVEMTERLHRTRADRAARD
jgi:Ca-activated chloride channel homolog